MSLLTDTDYDKIFTFYTELNKNYDDFENLALQLLDDLFNLRLATYAIFDRDADGHSYVCKIISKTFRVDHLEQYRKHYYKLDVFYNSIQNLVYNPAYKCVYTSDDLPPGVFGESEYGKWLSSLNVAHQAILGGSNSTKRPMHVLCVYKTHPEGTFTSWELELFYHIGMAFSASMNLYKQHIQQTRLMELTSGLADTCSLGYAILDHNLDPLSHNAQFITYGTWLSDKMEVPSIIQDLIEMARQSPAGNVKEQVARRDGYTISFQEKKLYISPYFESYYFLKIQRDANRVAEESHPVYEPLSERETEVAELLRQGLRSTEIAKQLYVSQSTVKSHIRNIEIKLGASSRSELQQRLMNDHR